MSLRLYTYSIIMNIIIDSDIISSQINENKWQSKLRSFNCISQNSFSRLPSHKQNLSTMQQHMAAFSYCIIIIIIDQVIAS